jgi:hypothetical protein
VTRVSKAIGPVAASSDPNLLAPITLAPTPQVFGNEAVNNTLRAVAGTWDVGVRLAYQWLRNGAAIPGAISSIYKISSDDVGATLSVSITGSKPNVEPVTKLRLLWLHRLGTHQFLQSAEQT